MTNPFAGMLLNQGEFAGAITDEPGGRSEGPGFGALGSAASRRNKRMLPVWLSVRTGSASAINWSIFFTGDSEIECRDGGRRTTPSRG